MEAISNEQRCAAPAVPAPHVPPGWTVDGPFFKDKDHYLSDDGANPEAPWPGYGWPGGTECWWYRLGGPTHLIVTGSTMNKAARRVEAAVLADDPARFTGAVLP